MISQSYRYPLRAPHGAFVARLLRMGRELGLLASLPDVIMSRRHRMMFTMDEHRHYRGHVLSGDLVPPVAAVSAPTEFGPLCFAVATLGPEHFSVGPEKLSKDTRIDGRLRIEQAHLALDLQHRERVRSSRLSDEDATRQVEDRERQIRLLEELLFPITEKRRV
jgi:hypothetical protein